MDVVDLTGSRDNWFTGNTSGVLDLANAVITNYATARLQEAARHKEACGCRSCTAAGNRWLAWVAGEDSALYERLRFRFKWESNQESTHPGEAA